MKGLKNWTQAHGFIVLFEKRDVLKWLKLAQPMPILDAIAAEKAAKPLRFKDIQSQGIRSQIA